MAFIYILLLSGAFALVQCLAGGVTPIFCNPSYALAALAVALAIFSFRRPISKPSATALLSALLFAGYIVARAHFSPIASLALPDMLEAFGCLLVYLLTALYLTETRHRLWVVGVLVLIAIAEIGIGCIQFARDPGFMLFGFVRDSSATRAGGMFVSGNHFAFYLETVAALALGICVWGRWPLAVKALALYFALLCYAGVAISGSRGGYISSGASILAFAAASTWVSGAVNPQKRYPVFLVSALLLMFVGAIAANLMSRSQLVSWRVEQIKTPNERAYYWKAALDQFHVSPKIGTGSGTYLIYGRLFRDPLIQQDPVHVHNDYLELLAEYGVAGTTVAGLFLLCHLVSGFRDAREIAVRRLHPGGGWGGRSDSLALAIGALAALAALICHSVVDFNMHIPGNALVVAFLFGILANPGAGRAAERPAWLSLTTLLRLVAPVGGVAALVLLLPTLKGARLSEQARVALRDKHYSECIGFAAAAAAADPENPNNYFYLGEANRIAGMQISIRTIQLDFLQKSAVAFQEGLKRFPQDENLNFRLGQALDGLGEFTAADQAYRDAIAQDPSLGLLYGFYGAHLRLLHALTGERHCLEAATHLGGAVARESGTAEARILLQFYDAQ